MYRDGRNYTRFSLAVVLKLMEILDVVSDNDTRIIVFGIHLAASNIKLSFNKSPINLQCCRGNHVKHLDHLLFYGSEMNSRNSGGNTALHVSALNNQVPLPLPFCQHFHHFTSSTYSSPSPHFSTFSFP